MNIYHGASIALVWMPWKVLITFLSPHHHRVHIESSFGCDRGHSGDMILFGPPFIITKEQINEMIEMVNQAITAVEKLSDL